MKIIVLLIFILLSGCIVNNDQINMAQEVCKDHGGLKEIGTNLLGLADSATCNDGLTFDIKELNKSNKDK